jgi:hypothetical protein
VSHLLRAASTSTGKFLITYLPLKHSLDWDQFSEFSWDSHFTHPLKDLFSEVLLVGKRNFMPDANKDSF